MKSFILSIALLAGLNVSASTVDSYNLPITGVQTEENFTMNAVQTKTEYKNETVANTCYRTVFAGYRQECRQEPVVICYPGGPAGQVCSTRFETRCYQVPQYRQEAYTCYQTVSTPYEVFSHNVQANVNVRVAKAPSDIQAPHNTCSINFILSGEAFRPSAHCAEFVILAESSNTETREPFKVTQNRALSLTLIDAQKLAAPTKGGIADMRLEGQTLTFRTGNLNKNSNFSLKLYIERQKIFGSDETVINRNLVPSEYSFEQINDDFGIVKINLSKLVGGINTKRKNFLKVTLDVPLDRSKVINATLPVLSVDNSITVNN